MNKTGKSYVGLILLIPLFIILALIIIDTITSYNENKRFKSITENIITEVLNNEELTEEDYENEIKRLYERNNYETDALVVIPSSYDLYVGNEHSYFGMFTSLKNHTNKLGEIKIFGQEENIEYYNILKTRILLNDIEDEEIEYQNNEKNKKIKFDYILSNPPYSKKDWKEIIKYRPIFQEYEISENAVGDYAFVISMLDNLKDDGKMAVLLPHGVLFRENERKVRKNLVEKNEIEAIIGLPENLFYDTRIPVIMMIISKNKTDKNILFIDASNEYKNKRFKNILSEENQNKIVNTYKERKEIEGFSKIVSINQVKENDYNLSIKKYIRKNYVRNNIEQKQLIQQLKNLEDEQDILEENIKDILSILNIKDIEKYEKHEKAKTSKIYYDFDDKKIGNNIKNARIKKSYTQERLAEKLELSCRYISMLERGMTGIRLEMLAKICNVLEVSIDEILK